MNVARVIGGGQTYVVLECLTHVGTAVYFMPTDFAKTVAHMILEQAGGIIVPPGPLPSL